MTYTPPWAKEESAGDYGSDYKIWAAIILGIILLGAGCYLVYSGATAEASYQSTFTLGPDEYSEFEIYLPGGAVIVGQFQVMSGGPVSFFIMSSQQRSMFVKGTALRSLFSVLEARSGSFSYAVPLPDFYHLVFLHGPRFASQTSNVAFERHYRTLFLIDYAKLVGGSISLLIGAALLLFGLREHRRAGKAEQIARWLENSRSSAVGHRRSGRP